MKIFHFDTIRCIFKVLLWWLLWFVSDDSDSESNSISNAFIATFFMIHDEIICKKKPSVLQNHLSGTQVQMALFRRRIAIWEGGGNRRVLPRNIGFYNDIPIFYRMIILNDANNDFICMQKLCRDSSIESFIAMKLK